MKKFFVLMLAVFMTIALVACSSSGSESSSSASEEASAAGEEASAEATEEASAEASEEASPAEESAEATEEASADTAENASTSGGVNTTGETITVGIINNPPSESGYREANVKDFEDMFSAENGYDAKTYYSLKNDEQLNAAQQFITDGVDYLLISAAETTGWDSVLESAKENGIGVFLFDRMIDTNEDNYEAAVVSDMPAEGETAVTWLLSQPNDEFNVVHIQGVMGSDAQLGRTGALDNAAAEGKVNIVAQQTASWDEAEAKKIVESVINSGDSFNVIYAENDGMARGAVAALDEAGITHGTSGDVIIMGFDTNKWALEELLNGNWNYDGQCSPFQAQAIAEMIMELENGGTISQKKVISQEKGFDAATITAEDVDTYGIGS